MAVGWFGSIARRRSQPRWPKQPTRQAPTSYCEASTHVYTAKGRRKCPGHDDRARRRHSGELRAAFGPYQAHQASQRELGDAMGVLRSCCGGERVARRELVPSMATAEPLLLLRCFGERRKQRKQEGSVALVGAHGRAAASRRRTPAAGQASHGAWPGRSVDRRRAAYTRPLFSETGRHCSTSEFF